MRSGDIVRVGWLGGCIIVGGANWVALLASLEGTWV